MSDVKFCEGCCHPMYMHRHGGGCHAGLYAANTSVLAFTGCSCAHGPDDFQQEENP